MLHRSFKPAKCKTSLRLATSRIKLLKNKKDVQVRQMKRDLAQLLESGQDQTARIRVEHVVREEKMMGAYDLLDIYCELIVSRLQIIESQKNCPIDLKEAITSLVFASPRCADIPELMDIRKHFTAKYGKEFINGAVELRPDCGVSRILVEKLSATAPDGQTKVKILSAIAEEHNIKWDPKSFGERDSKPPDDLLNGPNTFDKASKLQQQASSVQAPKVQAPPSPDQRHNPPVKSFEQNMTSAPSMQAFDPAYSHGTSSTMPTAYPPDTRSSGRDPSKEVRESFSGKFNAVPMGRENWNMEFKDATSAAQAAAEAAERASMAARAAAELSSQERRQHFEQPRNPNPHGTRVGPTRYADSKLPSEYIAKDSEIRSFDDQNSKFRDEQIDGNEHEQHFKELRNPNAHGTRKGSTKYADSKLPSEYIAKDSENRSFNDQNSEFRNEQIDGNEHRQQFDEFRNPNPHGTSEGPTRYVDSKSTSEYIAKDSENRFSDNLNSNFRSEQIDGNEYGNLPSKNTQSGDYEVKTVSSNSQNFDSFVEKNIREESETFSSSSRSSSFGADYSVPNPGSQTVGNHAYEDPPEIIHSTSMRTNGKDSIFFDDYGSVDDDNDCRFVLEPKYDDLEPKYDVLEPKYDDLEPKYDDLEPKYDDLELKYDDLKPKYDDLKPKYNDLVMKYDEQDMIGSSDKSSYISGERQHESSSKVAYHSPSDRESPAFDQTPAFDHSDGPESEGEDDRDEPASVVTVDSWTGTRVKKSQLELDNERSPPSRFSSVKTVDVSFHSLRTPPSTNTDKLLNEENLDNDDDGMELKMGTLTGGFRNKGYIRPPYFLNPSIGSSRKNASEDVSIAVEKAKPSLPTKSSSSSRVPTKRYDSDSDSNIDEETTQKIVSVRRRPNSYLLNPSTKLSPPKEDISITVEKPKRYNSDSDFDSDMEKEITPETVSVKRGPKPISKPVAYCKDDDSEEDVRQQTPSGRGRLGNTHYSRRTKAGAKVSQESGKERAFAWTSKWSEIPGKPDAGPGEESTKLAESKPLRESGISAPNSSAVENSVKKASHVHPKLPDYDTIAAKLQSFRP